MAASLQVPSAFGASQDQPFGKGPASAFGAIPVQPLVQGKDPLGNTTNDGAAVTEKVSHVIFLIKNPDSMPFTVAYASTTPAVVAAAADLAASFISQKSSTHHFKGDSFKGDLVDVDAAAVDYCCQCCFYPNDLKAGSHATTAIAFVAYC